MLGVAALFLGTSLGYAKRASITSVTPMPGVALVNVSAAAKGAVCADPIATPTPAHLSISMGVLNPGSAVRGHSAG